MKKYLIIILSVVFMFAFLTPTFAAKEADKQEVKVKYEIPPSVMNVTKENTYPNPTEDLPFLQPSDLSKELISTSKVKIENPDLIRMLNETTINSTPFAIGYRAIIYLG